LHSKGVKNGFGYTFPKGVKNGFGYTFPKGVSNIKNEFLIYNCYYNITTIK
jgi:hypothetical protein